MAMSLCSLAPSLPLSLPSFFLMQIQKKPLHFSPCFSFLLIPLYSPIYCPLSSLLLLPPFVLPVRRARVRVSSLRAAEEHHQGRLPARQRGGQLLQGTLSVQDWCHPGGTQERDICTPAHRRYCFHRFNALLAAIDWRRSDNWWQFKRSMQTEKCFTRASGCN